LPSDGDRIGSRQRGSRQSGIAPLIAYCLMPDAFLP